MGINDKQIRRMARDAPDRFGFWSAFLDASRVRSVAEIGVYRAEFTRHILEHCPRIRRYYMIDPWRHLEQWDKPMNVDDERFEELYRDALGQTEEYTRKRVVLRGTTTEVIDKIKDRSLDFAYIDGDHTLRGITIDLQRVYPKVRNGGWIGGDDFTRTIFQHGEDFEPTLVFPYAVHFAEAVGARIYALPHRQFLLQKVRRGEHQFIDLGGRYANTTLLAQLKQRRRALRRQRQRAHEQSQAGQG